MATKSRGTMRSEIQRRLSTAHQALLKHVRHVTGADSDLMKAAGAVLQKKIRGRLSTKGANQRVALKVDKYGKRRVYGDPSAPGESPRQQRGDLRRRIKNTVRQGERTVIADDFRAHILEFGAASPGKPSRVLKRGKNKGRTLPATTARTQAPRPFMRPGLEDARPELAKVGAQILRTQGVPISMRQGG